jgi:hypothetical protein
VEIAIRSRPRSAKPLPRSKGPDKARYLTVHRWNSINSELRLRPYIRWLIVATAHRRLAARPIATCLSWGIPAASIKHKPTTKRPNAIHLGCMMDLNGSPHSNAEPWMVPEVPRRVFDYSRPIRPRFGGFSLPITIRRLATMCVRPDTPLTPDHSPGRRQAGRGFLVAARSIKGGVSRRVAQSLGPLSPRFR